MECGKCVIFASKLHCIIVFYGIPVSYFCAVSGVSVGGACGSSAWAGDGFCD